ncbi:MAG: DegT/DnrJ/EryC1/StrS family aminotransferase [Opitutaceae bacterium]|nr:DegT/DnrJ/EryC1/StrS family aminotransferase [Opitutaceae bacterium]
MKPTLPPPATKTAAVPLALFGGPPAVTRLPDDLFTWPIVTAEDEEAVLGVLRRREMSGTAITMQFEQEFAAWMGVKHALGVNNGTASILGSLYGVGVGVGDEIICTPTTIWASAIPAFTLGATVVFADIDPDTLCLDAARLERHVTPRTKAIVVVHYLGHPADMDAIMAIARRHRIRVVEDMSHAQGGRYQGRKLGTFGDVAGYSLMTAKAFAIGEGGMITTNDREIYERALAFGHYERYNAGAIQTEYLKACAEVPLGGFKHRMHQMSSAMGRVQLRHYDARAAEIRRAMNHFWDLLEGVPGLRAHRVDERTGSTMGGWYAPRGLYRREELGGLSVSRFCEAVRAEGVTMVYPGCNKPLHVHPAFNDADIYGHGKPTRLVNADRDLRQPPGSLPVAERICRETYMIPWFKHHRPAEIAEYAAAFRKVAQHAAALLPGDTGDAPDVGGWSLLKAARAG